MNKIFLGCFEVREMSLQNVDWLGRMSEAESKGDSEELLRIFRLLNCAPELLNASVELGEIIEKLREQLTTADSDCLKITVFQVLAGIEEYIPTEPELFVFADLIGRGVDAGVAVTDTVCQLLGNGLEFGVFLRIVARTLSSRKLIEVLVMLPPRRVDLDIIEKELGANFRNMVSEFLLIRYRSFLFSIVLASIHPSCSKYAFCSSLSFANRCLPNVLLHFFDMSEADLDNDTEKGFITKRESTIFKRLLTFIKSDVTRSGEVSEARSKEFFDELFGDRDPFEVILSVPASDD